MWTRSPVTVGMSGAQSSMGERSATRTGPAAVALAVGGDDQVVVLELDRHDRLTVGDVESELAGHAGQGEGGSGSSTVARSSPVPTGEHRGREAAGVTADDDEVVFVSHRAT